MRATVEDWPEPATVTASPGRTVPAATVPQKPRKSRSGRLTHCTGSRNGSAPRSSSTSAPSRQASSVPPRYHGMRPEGSDMLSP